MNDINNITNRYNSIGDDNIINDCYIYGNRPLSDYQKNGIDTDASDSKIMFRDFSKVRKKLEKALCKEECLPFKIIERFSWIGHYSIHNSQIHYEIDHIFYSANKYL